MEDRRSHGLETGEFQSNQMLLVGEQHRNENKLLLISQAHLFSECFSPPYNCFAVIMNYLRTVTIKIHVNEPERPRRLDCLLIIDLQQQGDCQTHSC
jgi:hypothetical protein